VGGLQHFIGIGLPTKRQQDAGERAVE
jgi:hypothetical protein